MAAREDDDGVDVMFLRSFMRVKADVTAQIEEIKECTEQVIELHEQSQDAVRGDGEARISAELKRVTDRAKELARKAKAALDKMKSDSQKMRQENGAADRTFQVHNQHYQHLVKSYVDAVKEHQRAKEAYQDSNKDRMLRRARLFFKSETDEYLEKKIEENPTGFVREALLAENASVQVQEAYHEVQSRARDVEMLAKSIQEVHQMFQDFALLVSHQHDQIDSIEVVVESAAKRVEKGNTEIEKAIEYQKKIRKRWCCIAITVCVILVIGAGVLGGVV